LPVKTVTLQVTALTDAANRNITATGAYFERLRKANPVELSVRFDKLQAIAEAKILAKEMSQTVRDTIKLDVDKGGVLTRLLGSGPGGGGLLGLLFPGGAAAGTGGAGIAAAGPAAAGAGGGTGIGLGAIAAITALEAGVAGIIPAMAAAAGAVGAFGVLAIPTFMNVSGALTKISADTAAYQNATTAAAKSTALKRIQQDWAALDPAQRQAVKGIQGLQAEFGKLAVKLEPVTMKVFNEGLKIADKLLPDLLPFAQAAGNAIVTLLQGFDKFASSPGFRAFQKQMLALAGPTILAIGEGFGKIVVALGKLLAAMANPNGVRILRLALEGVALVITGIAWAFAYATPRVIHNIRELASGFDRMRHDIAAGLQVLVQFFTSTLPTAFDIFKESLRIAFDQVKILALDTVLGITTAFGHLPGRLGQPFRDASKSIRGQLAGIQADVVNAASNIAADWQRLNGLNATLFLTIAGTGPIPGKTFPRGFAGGTSFAPPGWWWAGERGAGLIYSPHGGETVIPASVARGYAGGAWPGGRDTEILDAIDETNGLLRALIGVTAAAPATTGASLGAALGGAARRAGYRQLYR